MDDSKSKPSYSFSDEPDEGLYLAGGEVVCIAKGGTVRATAADVMRSMWRPIESAPTDGQVILCRDGETVAGAYWFKPPDENGFWCEASRDAFIFQPTHWTAMPVF